ncbi:hypothetical protein KQX54_012364 [Cotesia glomerata]|uniref:Uncharacterized protein n=1 Tax=Cotesia glomerata TaxID=32391 RepID=A0AAV7I977_COTGL|nr:hypothetical protein KQX54_012364 [Cotesia glomerata]
MVHQPPLGGSSATRVGMVKKTRDANFQNSFGDNYLAAKKKYKALLKTKKCQHSLELLNKLANTRNFSEFWYTVRALKSGQSFQSKPIVVKTWEKFYEDTIPARENDDTMFYGVLDLFYYGAEKVEMENSYKYLGLTTTPNGFSQATVLNSIKKAQLAVNMVAATVFKAKSDSTDSIFKLR